MPNIKKYLFYTSSDFMLQLLSAIYQKMLRDRINAIIMLHDTVIAYVNLLKSM